MKAFRGYTILAAACLSTGAYAESFAILGRTISYSPPAGYCTPGTSAIEKVFTERAKASMPSTVRLVYWSAPCDQLQDLREGRREKLTEWLQIQLLAPKGTPALISISREDFLAGLSKSQPKISIEELQRQQRKSLSDPRLAYQEHSFQLIGRDGNAVYSVFSGVLATSTGQVRFRGIGAITLINSLPLTVAVYGPADGPPQRTMEVQRELLTSLLTSN